MQVLRTLTLAAATFLGGLPSGLAHQTPPSPPESEVARSRPALKGSAEFMREAPGRLRDRCTAGQLEDLDDVLTNLQYSEALRWGSAAKPQSQRASEYFRWKAEQRFLRFLSTFQDVVEINLNAVGVRDSAEEPLALDHQHSSLLLHVVTGAEGPTEFDVQQWDLTEEETARGREVVVGDTGETYVLIEMQGAPSEGMIARFPIRRASDPEPRWWRAVAWESKPWGQLVIDITDEDGEPTHALMSLRSKRGGVLWPPAGAIDFRPQLNDIVGPPIFVFEPGLGYTFYLPGERRGHYWVVPPHVEMAVPAGPWEITILRGPEHTVVRDDITVTADRWTRKRYITPRWTDMSQKGWWSGDDHVHARMLSGDDATRLLKYCEAVDLRLANILEMGDPLRTYYTQRGFGPEFRSELRGRWVVPGQEDPRSELGHAIGLNLSSLVRDLDRYLLNDELADEIHEQGGLYGHTHVGANACFAHREMALFTPMGIVDFNSIMQADLGTELYYNFLNLGFKMTASAGSDTPYGGAVGNVRVYAYTGDSTRLDPNAWFAALQQGKTFVSNGPMLDFTVDDQGPGATINLDAPRTVRVRARAWGAVGESAPKELHLVSLGKPVSSKQPSSDDQSELALEVDVPSGDGCWLALHAVGHDGSEAHTTPVYISVGGRRHWDPVAAPGLLELQLEVLDEIEHALEHSKALIATNGNPVDFWNQVNAEQADLVLQRVGAARAFYQGLREQLPEPGETAEYSRPSGAGAPKLD